MYNIKIPISFMVFIVFISVNVEAQQNQLNETELIATNNIINEIVSCSAFTGIVSSVAKSSDEQELFESYIKYAEELILRALKISELINEDRAWVFKKIEDATGVMRKSIDNDAANISILINQYGLPCVDVINDQESRIEYWYDEANKEK